MRYIAIPPFRGSAGYLKEMGVITQTFPREIWDSLSGSWKTILLNRLKTEWNSHLWKHNRLMGLRQQLLIFSELKDEEKFMVVISMQNMAKGANFDTENLKTVDCLDMIDAEESKWTNSISEFFPNCSKVLEINTADRCLEVLKDLGDCSSQYTFIDPVLADMIYQLSIVDTLSCKNTRLGSLKPLSLMYGLKRLNLSYADVQEMGYIGELERLEALSCVGIGTSDLDFMKPLSNLTSLLIGRNPIDSLKSLNQHKNLKMINCRGTRIKRREVFRFRKENPRCTVKWGFFWTSK